MKTVTPTKIGVCLLLVIILVPQAAFYFYGRSISLIGFLWAINYSTDEGFRIAINTFSGLSYSFLFLGLGFIYIYQVVQYCRGKAGRTSTIVAGIASICPILLLMTIPDLLSGFDGLLHFPVPILLVTGLAAMRYTGPKEPTTPWDEKSNLQIDSP